MRPDDYVKSMESDEYFGKKLQKRPNPATAKSLTFTFEDAANEALDMMKTALAREAVLAGMYEDVKREKNVLLQENEKLRSENEKLRIEIDKLKQQIAGTTASVIHPPWTTDSWSNADVEDPTIHIDVQLAKLEEQS